MTAALRSIDQPVLGGFSAEEREAAGLVMRDDYYDQKIVEKIGADAMLNRRLNHYVCHATILGHTREYALELLVQRSVGVRELLGAVMEESD